MLKLLQNIKRLEFHEERLKANENKKFVGKWPIN